MEESYARKDNALSFDPSTDTYRITAYITRDVYDKGLSGWTCQYTGSELIAKCKDAFELKESLETDWVDAIEATKKHLKESIEEDSEVEADLQAWIEEKGEARIIKRAFIHEDEL